DNEGANGLIALIGLVVGAIATAILTRPSLDSGRPPEKLVAEQQRDALQNIDARLWEDPFAVLSRHAAERKAQAPPGNGKGKTTNEPVVIDGFCSSFRSLQPKPDRLLLMPVMLSNAP